jgi:hypothetical protein
VDARTVPSDGAAQQVISEALTARGPACFVPAVLAATRASGLTDEDASAALEEMSASGRVLIQDNFCADPHLDGVDLRVVSLVADPEDPGAQTRAREEMERTWSRWLGEFLSNHRCG